MNLVSSNLFRAAAVALALPLLGVSAAVQINSTCYGPGSCSNPANVTDSVSIGNPVSGSILQSFSVGSDTYSLSATYSSTYSGSGENLAFNPLVSYTGAAPSTSSDVIKIDFFQDIYDPSSGPFSASTQTENVPLVIPAGAFASGQLFFNGTPLPLVGPYGPGSYDVSNSQAFGPVTGDYLGYDYQFIFEFAAGASPGSSLSAAAPEPAQTIPAALSLAGIVLLALRRRKQ